MEADRRGDGRILLVGAEWGEIDMFTGTLNPDKLKSFEIELPAPWIDDQDRDWAFQSRMLLSTIIDQFEAAVIAFTLFEPLDVEKMIQRGADGEITITRRKWEDSLRSASVKMFVSALDGIGKILGVLRRDDRMPPKAVEACNELSDQFEAIKHIRDSHQHMEDRCRGLGKWGKPVPSSVLVLGAMMDGRRHIMTASDGKQYGIEISEAVLRMVQANIEKLIWSFEWIGPDNIPIKRP